MLIVETIARIRREHFIKGKTIKEIARDLKVSRNTVRKVLRSGETSFEYERVVQPRPKLGRWAAELDGLLSGNAGKSAREQLTLIRIFEELRERGYDGGYDAVRRYASVGLGEGPGREPGWACPGALLHAAAAVQNPRRVERVAAGQVHRLRQGAPASRTGRTDGLGGVRSRAAEAPSLCRPVRRIPRGAGIGLDDLSGAVRQQ